MIYKNRREEISKPFKIPPSTNFIYLFFFSNLNNCTIHRYAVKTQFGECREAIIFHGTKNYNEPRNGT